MVHFNRITDCLKLVFSLIFTKLLCLLCNLMKTVSNLSAHSWDFPFHNILKVYIHILRMLFVLVSKINKQNMYFLTAKQEKYYAKLLIH